VISACRTAERRAYASAVPDAERYRLAFLDWLACAARGVAEPAAQAARAASDGLAGDVAAAGCAGHVLDYDDTHAAGLVHASAPVAPVALLLAAHRDQPIAAALAAHAAGFEATAALARASHPALYERGWHPTSVCGSVGAAVAAARLLEVAPEQEQTAVALALVQAAGLRAAFGTDGKALQVGLAAAAGMRAAQLAAAGARVAAGAVVPGFESAYGGAWAQPGREPAIRENWIKAHPCCLMTHAAIDAAEELRASGAVPDAGIVVVVHPTARQAAPYDAVADGLQAKFSIPYTTAHTLLHGPPTVDSFATPDEPAATLAAERISLRTDAGLDETEARLEAAGEIVAAVRHARGSPQNPMDGQALAQKVERLAPGLSSVLDDPDAPAARAVAAAGLAPGA
jgi:2-methylcitrate dehydratase PrpD